MGREQDVEDKAAFYERHQQWPEDVARGVAEHLYDALPEGGRAAFLGCGTGVNDVLPFARRATKAVRILAGDIDPAYLEKLADRVGEEGLARVAVRRIDLSRDLPGLDPCDLVALFFVIHRIADWRRVADELPGRIAPGGVFFTSEFAGPEGVIYLSNENGGAGRDPVSRLIRRYFELLPGAFDPPLRSTRVRPFLAALEPRLVPDGHRDFLWPQSLKVADMFAKIEAGAYAPYFSTRAPRDLLDRLRSEFSSVWLQEVAFQERIRLYRYRRGG